MKVKIIPTSPVFNIPRPYRVAAYCRVSTPQEMQYHSLEAQRKHFEKYIDSKLNWIFAGVYAEQVSGRHNAKNERISKDDGRLPRREYRLYTRQVHQPSRTEHFTVFASLQRAEGPWC